MDSKTEDMVALGVAMGVNCIPCFDGKDEILIRMNLQQPLGEGAQLAAIGGADQDGRDGRLGESALALAEQNLLTGKPFDAMGQARKAMRQLDRILVVEGYMDVVALAQFDINYAVATLGTATTPEHLERIFRVVPEVIFCFDGDRAGRAAAWRALENTLPVLRDGREARFLFLPEGEDPDTLVRKIGRMEIKNEALRRLLDRYDR